MNRNRMLLGPSLALMATALIPQMTGCNATVENGDPDEGNATSKAVAQAPSQAGDDGSGTAVDDGSIVITLASDALMCSGSAPLWDNIDASNLECPGESHWWVRFRLSPDQQTPGIYPLQELQGFMSEIFAESPDACGLGGGTFWEGTVEVVSIDAEAVVVTLNGTVGLVGDSRDGTYEVLRCEAPPAPPSASGNAVAHEYDGTEYYEDENTSVAVTVGAGGGGSPYGPGLKLTIGNLVNACSATLPDCDAAGWGVQIILPPELQAVGSYPLFTPERQAIFSATLPASAPGECSGGGGTFDGTITILSIDSQNVVFELTNTTSVFEYGSVDGVYTAPRCD